MVHTKPFSVHLFSEIPELVHSPRSKDCGGKNQIRLIRVGCGMRGGEEGTSRGWRQVVHVHEADKSMGVMDWIES